MVGSSAGCRRRGHGWRARRLRQGPAAPVPPAARRAPPAGPASRPLLGALSIVVTVAHAPSRTAMGAVVSTSTARHPRVRATKAATSPERRSLSFRRPDALAILAFAAIVWSAASVMPGRAGGSDAGWRPPPVSVASLTQHGQQLVWQVELAVPFSPGTRPGWSDLVPADRAGRDGTCRRSALRRRSGPIARSTPRLVFIPAVAAAGPGAAHLDAATRDPLELRATSRQASCRQGAGVAVRRRCAGR